MADLMYDLEAIRAKMRKKKGNKGKDPNEWRPDKAEANKSLKWKFFILPPTDGMDMWYYEHGNHFIDNKVLECPRIHDDGITCPLCQFGFDLMKDTEEKDERRAIAKKYLSSSRYSVNIYFPAVDSTPAELRGKVMWFSMPQSVYAICDEVIMRDPPSADVLEPEPYGIFFDPNNAMPFVLEAKKKGEYNSYESSHFIGKKMPITKGGDEKIKEILAQRHNIPTLFQERDIDALQAIVDNMTGGGKVSVPKSEPKKTESKKSEPEEKKTSDEDELDDLMEEKTEEKVEAKPEKKPEAKKETKPEAKPEAKEEAKVEEEDEDLASLLNELNSDS